MSVNFGKITKTGLQNTKLAEKISKLTSEQISSVFSEAVEKNKNKSIKSSEANSNEVELTESDKKVTVEDVLKDIAQVISDNSLASILSNVLDTEEGDISDIDETNYISRDEALKTKDENDSFLDYCKSIKLDLDDATNDEITEAYTKYTQRVAEKNEFNELYDLMASDSSLAEKLDDKVKLGGSFVNKLMQGSLTDFHEDIAETGAFKTKGESGGLLYNKKFDTKISAGLEQMKTLLNEEGVSDEIKAQAEAIIQKYENQEKVAIGKRDTSSLNINSEIDEQVKQSATGDCYLLATLNSLQETESGKEILKEAIVDNGDGSFTVNLKGVNMSYTFTTEDLEAAEVMLADGSLGGSAVVGSGNERYSNGDDDAMLVEMAIEKFREEALNGTIKPKKTWPSYVMSTISKENQEKGVSALTSGNMDQILYLLSGIKTTSENDKEDISSVLDKIQKDIEENGAEYAIYAGVTAKEGYVEDENGNYYIKNGKYEKVTARTPENETRYSFVGAGSNNGYIEDPNGSYYLDEDGSYSVIKKGEEYDKRYSNVGGSGIMLGTKEDHIRISNNSTGNHAISVVGVTDDTVTIINPWDSDKIVEVPREDFENYMYKLQYAKLS